MNLLTGDVIDINPGWFKPQTITSSLTGKYGKKVMTNMIASAAITNGVSVVEQEYNSSNKKSTKTTKKVSQKVTNTLIGPQLPSSYTKNQNPFIKNKYPDFNLVSAALNRKPFDKRICYY